MAFLDETGLTRLWNKISSNFVDISTNQTIGGEKTFNGWVILNSSNGGDNRICTSSTANSISILGGGKSVNDGGYLVVYGKTHTNAGQFKIVTTDGTNNPALIGKPDGTLKWDGKDIITNGGTQTIGDSKTFSNDITLNNANVTYTISSGGSGGIVVSGEDADFEIGRDSPEYGAGLFLEGRHNLVEGGMFALKTGGYNFKSLVGSGNGTLTWNGDVIITNQIVLDGTHNNNETTGLLIRGNPTNYACSIQDTGYTKGTLPSVSRYWTYGDAYGTARTNTLDRVGMIETSVNTAGLSQTYISAYGVAATNTGTRCTITANVDVSGNAYATVTPAPAVADSSTKIPTTAWVRTATGNFACNAATATKLGTTTVGSGTKPIYLNAGAPTAFTATVGSASKPVYLNAGTVTALTATVGGVAKPVYLNAGGITACSATVGSTARPVYLNAGTITVGLAKFGACTATSAGTAGPVTAPAKGKQAQFLRGDATWAAPSTGSDRRVKQDFSTIPDEVLDAWDEINYKQFKLKDEVKEKGNDALYHTGLVVQDIQEVFEQKNLDANKYDMIIHEVWPAHDDEYDEEGNLISPKDDGYEQYFMHYEEALSIEAAYLRKQVTLLKARMDELESEIKILKNR